MNIFGVGPLELLLVLVLGFVVLGPARMATMARKAGRLVKDVGKMTEGLPRTLEELADESGERRRRGEQGPEKQPAPSEPTAWQPAKPEQLHGDHNPDKLG
ncbi:MAG: hypothetical protein EXR48_03715 [Dehalococcoidia bacterium]|nr:hypothetical protein [Dehalococcoidia bacterium]